MQGTSEHNGVGGSVIWHGLVAVGVHGLSTMGHGLVVAVPHGDWHGFVVAVPQRGSITGPHVVVALGTQQVVFGSHGGGHCVDSAATCRSDGGWQQSVPTAVMQTTGPHDLVAVATHAGGGLRQGLARTATCRSDGWQQSVPAMIMHALHGPVIPHVSSAMCAGGTVVEQAVVKTATCRSDGSQQSVPAMTAQSTGLQKVTELIQGGPQSSPG